jgi:hypothetical protein
VAEYVLYLGCDDDGQAKFGGCDDPRGILIPGTKYMVANVELHSWHTKIYLVGCGKLAFNSVLFVGIHTEEEE